MINPSFDDLKERSESRYELVMVIADRARRIVNGSKAVVETKNDKPVTIAIEELMAGKIDFESIED